MTPEEAISLIQTAKAEVEWNYPLEYAEAFAQAINALEKQTSKSLKPTGTWYPLECPVCGERFVPDLGYKHCPMCGQAIKEE